jgi:hypothetical protein
VEARIVKCKTCGEYLILRDCVILTKNTYFRLNVEDSRLNVEDSRATGLLIVIQSYRGQDGNSEAQRYY